jgi:malate dehydrogenase
MAKKVAVIGGGNVGASCAMYLAERDIADIVVVDIVEGVPQGKGLDLTQAAPVRGYDTLIEGTNDFSAIRGADMVVVTAGLPRKPGMTREDLLKSNAAIISDVGAHIKKHAPEAFVLVVSNPLDIMTYHMQRVTGFPHARVFGQAGVLDSIRFRAFLAMELKVSAQDIQTLVLGGHGDSMVPLLRFTTVNGIPIQHFVSPKRLGEIAARTRDGGGEIVRLLKTGSAYYAPAAASVQMAEAVLLGRRRVLAMSAYLNGQYGMKDLYIGVPCILGPGGTEEIIELDLNQDELTELQNSGKIYKESLSILGY